MRKPAWMTYVLALACTLAVPSKAFPVEGVVDPPSTGAPRLRHEHGAWTIVASPLILGKIDSDIADGSDANGEHGVSALVSRRLSRSAMLDFGMLIARTRDRDGASYSYIGTITPKVIVAKSQRDRFFAGLGLAILALDESGSDLRWGFGPQATLGVDIEMTRATCLCVAGEFGITGIGKYEIDANSEPPDEPLPEGGGGSGKAVAWVRLALGIRFSL